MGILDKIGFDPKWVLMGSLHYALAGAGPEWIVCEK